MTAFEPHPVRSEQVAEHEHADNLAQRSAILRVRAPTATAADRSARPHVAIVNPAHRYSRSSDGYSFTCRLSASPASAKATNFSVTINCLMAIDDSRDAMAASVSS